MQPGDDRRAGARLVPGSRYSTEFAVEVAASKYMDYLPLERQVPQQPGRVKLRGVVVGRKNHYGSRSKRGTQVAVLLYSLYESAQMSGVEPKSYVLHATRAALADRWSQGRGHTLLRRVSKWITSVYAPSLQMYLQWEFHDNGPLS